MESVAESIAATCPLSFGGTSGSLFVSAITSVIAAHCALFADHQWPADKADEIIRSQSEASYDFIVVGAGTAGTLVASRLSNIYPDLSVLLIEAGDDPGIESEVPAFVFHNQQKNNDWSYKTVPDGHSCLGFKNNSCIWSKGKGMGGSSSINAMLYIRGHRNDFDDWKLSENAEWGYDDLKKYFELQEAKYNLTNLARTGNDGWYTVIDEAWKQLGFTSHKYNNYEGLVGTKKCTLLTKNGKRFNTAKINLQEASNLHVIKNTMVVNIILDKNSKRAMGVKVKHSSGLTKDITANKEVILSAGSISTPQLLMLSGIGPKKHLNELGIQCLADLPVGKNLQDHMIFPLFLKTNQHVSLPPSVLNLLILEYMLTRTGPLSNLGIIDYFGLLNTKNSSDQPNIQFHHIYITQNDVTMLRPYIEGVGYKREIIEDIMSINKKHDMLGLYPTLLHPKSKGEVLLRDADWKAMPIIKTNYLHNSEDMQTYIDAIKFVHKLEQTEAFKSMDLKLLEVKIPGCSTLEFDSDSYWRCYIKHMATSVYHPVGTAKMGNDDTSVVDHKLQVRGIKNLRVVDASIMPSIPGANVMAATLAIAHKAVDIIIKQYSYKDEL